MHTDSRHEFTFNPALQPWDLMDVALYGADDAEELRLSLRKHQLNAATVQDAAAGETALALAQGCIQGYYATKQSWCLYEARDRLWDAAVLWNRKRHHDMLPDRHIALWRNTGDDERGFPASYVPPGYEAGDIPF